MSKRSCFCNRNVGLGFDRIKILLSQAVLLVLVAFGTGCSNPAQELVTGESLPVSFSNYTVDQGLASNFVNRITANGSGVWAATGSVVVGSGGGGLSYSTDKGKTWTTYGGANAPDSISVVCVTVCEPTIYASSFYNGLSVSQNNGAYWSNLSFVIPGTTYEVALSDTTVFVASTGGLFSRPLAGGSWHDYHNFRDGKTQSDVLSIGLDGNNIYAGTFLDGIAISSDGGMTWKFSTTANGLGGTTVRKVIGKGLKVYAATDGGVSISSDGGTSWTTSTTENGLMSNEVSDLSITDTYIVAATWSGLCYSYDSGKTWKALTTANGLGSNVINGVCVVDDVVFVATAAGVSVGHMPKK